jgi:hypothetical protein
MTENSGENGGKLPEIEAKIERKTSLADALFGASEDLIGAEGRRVSGAIERLARQLCIREGCDPDSLAPDYMMEKDRAAAGNPVRRWEDWIDEAREVFGREYATIAAEPTASDMLAEDLAAGIHITRTHADGSSERIDPNAFYFPGELDEAPAVAPSSLEEMHAADVETALIERALAAEKDLAEVSDGLSNAFAENAKQRAEGRMMRDQMTFLSSALTRQIERCAGLRLYGGELRAEQVTAFVGAEVAAVDAQLGRIRAKHEQGE